MNIIFAAIILVVIKLRNDTQNQDKPKIITIRILTDVTE